MSVTSTTTCTILSPQIDSTQMHRCKFLIFLSEHNTLYNTATPSDPCNNLQHSLTTGLFDSDAQM